MKMIELFTLINVFLWGVVTLVQIYNYRKIKKLQKENKRLNILLKLLDFQKEIYKTIIDNKEFKEGGFTGSSDREVKGVVEDKSYVVVDGNLERLRDIVKQMAEVVQKAKTKPEANNMSKDIK